MPLRPELGGYGEIQIHFRNPIVRDTDETIGQSGNSILTEEVGHMGSTRLSTRCGSLWDVRYSKSLRVVTFLESFLRANFRQGTSSITRNGTKEDVRAIAYCYPFVIRTIFRIPYDHS